MKPVIMFTASWCGPCQRLKPQLQALASQEGFHLEMVDIDEQHDRASRAGVRSVPTVHVGTTVLTGTITPQRVKDAWRTPSGG